VGSVLGWLMCDVNREVRGIFVHALWPCSRSEARGGGHSWLMWWSALFGRGVLDGPVLLYVLVQEGNMEYPFRGVPRRPLEDVVQRRIRVLAPVVMLP
jgi:hypothetical protein